MIANFLNALPQAWQISLSQPGQWMVDEAKLSVMNDVTTLLQRLQAGEDAASDELLVVIYRELREQAQRQLSREKPGQTLQATALVHEGSCLGTALPGGGILVTRYDQNSVLTQHLQTWTVTGATHTPKPLRSRSERILSVRPVNSTRKSMQPARNCGLSKTHRSL